MNYVDKCQLFISRRRLRVISSQYAHKNFPAVMTQREKGDATLILLCQPNLTLKDCAITRPPPLGACEIF